MSLSNHIENIKENLKRGAYVSEASVSQGIILPTLNNLGWPVFDTSIVIPEYSLEGRRVDFALCHPKNRPAVFVEVKRVGNTSGADRQLFEYAFHVGVPIAILTDGQEWNFYLPGEQGKYDERRVYKLDLLERDTDEALRVLNRYLHYDRICSGDALKDARSDYNDVTKYRVMERTFPKAWKELITEQDSMLIEIIAEKVEDLCGYRPDVEQCGHFLENIHSYPYVTKISEPTKKNIPVSNNYHTGGYSFTFKGIQYNETSARAVAASVFRLLANEDSSFLSRFAARKHGKKRRYIARNKLELYPDRPDLADYSVEFVHGWWMATNYSRKSFMKIIELARDVIGQEIGEQLQVDLS